MIKRNKIGLLHITLGSLFSTILIHTFLFVCEANAVPAVDLLNACTSSSGTDGKRCEKHKEFLTGRQRACESELKAEGCGEAMASATAEAKAKFRTCDGKDICLEALDPIKAYYGCTLGVGSAAVDAITGLFTFIPDIFEAGAKCNADLEGKLLRIEEANRLLTSFHKIEMSISVIDNMPCDAVDKLIDGRFKKDEADFRGLRDSPALLRTGPGVPEGTERMREKLKSMTEERAKIAILKKKMREEMKENLDRLWKELGIKINCYNAKEKAQMICYAGATVLTMFTGAGALAKSGQLGRLAKMSGSQKALNAFDRVSRHPDEARAMIARVLQNSKLSMEGRLAEAQAMNGGRPLTRAQEDAVKRAHEFGDGQPGRDGKPAGVYNYTDAQLKEKLRILEDAGFTPDQAKQLIREGITGGDPSKAQVSGSLIDTMEAERKRQIGEPGGQNNLKSINGEDWKEITGNKGDIQYLERLRDGHQADLEKAQKLTGDAKTAAEARVKPGLGKTESDLADHALRHGMVDQAKVRFENAAKYFREAQEADPALYSKPGGERRAFNAEYTYAMAHDPAGVKTAVTAQMKILKGDKQYALMQAQEIEKSLPKYYKNNEVASPAKKHALIGTLIRQREWSLQAGQNVSSIDARLRALGVTVK